VETFDFDMIVDDCGDVQYILKKSIPYTSPRYKKTITCPAGMLSDGATCATDIVSMSWWVHDWICDTWKWDDETPITKWQASVVLYDLLMDEGRWFKAYTWFIAVLFFGPSPDSRV
jgi:hypothetical protein